MSNLVFPQLAGIMWDQKKIPIFNTVTQRTVNLKESRVCLSQYPIYEYELSYELLRDNVVNNELQTLMGFYLARQGAYDSFLYIDPSDCIVTGQQVGTGDGNTKAFQLYRTYGGWIDFITDIQPPGASPALPVLNVYLSDALQNPNSYSVNYYQSGILTFANAPAPGVTIKVNFSYYRRVRFVEYTEGSGDAFNNFQYRLWELKKVTLLQDKL
jgi:uncharacterized protein (TIGR02217 family)